MSQLVRGIGWRRGQALTLFLLGTVVVAGCLVAAGFSDLTDTPPGSVGVLLLLGVVALSVQAAGSARTRRPEIALAQIRGRHGVRLFAYFLTEPLTILLLAAVAGVLLGRLVTTLAADRWLATGAADPGRISTLGWWTVGVALLASVAAVVAGSWRTLREPLVEQLDAGHRPRPAATLVLFGQTLVIVAAVISGYQATQHAGSRDGWAGLVNPALLSPVLLGLAAGQLAAWALRGVATVSTRRTRGGGRMGAYLAVRRMARRSDTVFGTRLVIAAAVVTAVTASATTAVETWQDESTRLALGGPQQFTVPAGGLAAYELTHQVDPDGRWLMAMVEAPDQSQPYRRVFADTARWDVVAADFFSGTGAAGITDRVGSLDTGTPVEPAMGRRVSMTFDNASLRNVIKPSVTVLYATPGGSVEPVVLKVRGKHRPTGTTTVAARLDGCTDGCSVTQLVIDGVGHSDNIRVEPYLDITGIDFAGTQLLDDTTWRVGAGDTGFNGTRQRDGTLHVLTSEYGDPVDLEPAEATQPLAVLATPHLTLDREGKQPVGYAVDGSEHPVQRVGTIEALPFIGRRGMLMDLPRALAGGSTMIPTAAATVVARADTPAAVLHDLDATGLVSDPHEFGASLDRARRRADVQGVRLYTLMSVFAGLIALVGLAASVSGQRGERQREAASLRVSGVRARHIAAAHRQEALWLAVCAAVVAAATGWVAARVTLKGLSLVPQTAYTPVLQGDPSFRTLLVVAAGAGVLVGVVTLGVNRRIARSSPPSMLRDEVGG